MEIRVLRYFLAVARQGSVTGAANSLHLTQPTLSRQIKELEEQLGTKLFERRSHNVVLTAEGMRFRQRAEEILELVEKAQAEFTLPEGTVSGQIHIGGGETRAMRLIAKVLHGIRKDYPGVTFQLHSGNAEDVTERIDKGLLDFGVLIRPVDVGKYDYADIPSADIWGVLMRKDHPLAKKKAIRKADLRTVPLICSRWASRRGPANALLNWFGSDFDKLNVVATYNLIYNATLMVEEGIGVALSIDGLANTTSTSDICFKPLEPQVESGLYIVWKKYQVFHPAAQLFLRRILEEIGG
ncbi:MAG: LysR family transcriptional regulator [Planctomycetaceae bacterium]|nr:LysR family transcriptional regulator [Planctomycetaceae bacterium]